MFLEENKEIISEMLKNYTGESYTNIDDILDNIQKLEDFKKFEFFNKIKDKLGKDISYEVYSIISNNKMTNLTRNCRAIAVGTEYSPLKSKIIKKLLLDEKDNYINLDQITKMNLKERMDYKSEIDTLNSRYNIYEDIYNFLRNAKTTNSYAKIEQNIDKLYNDFVINDINQTIVDNILNNKDIYAALVIVRKDRLKALNEKLNEQIKI